MKKKPAAKRTVAAKTKSAGLAPLIAEVRNLIQSARRGVASVVDTFQVLTNFEIGRRIVEHEQEGKKRAGYRKELLKGLSARLTEEFGRGFSEDNLARMRAFYITWNERVLEFPRRLRGNPDSEIFQTPSGKSEVAQIGQKPSDQLAISATPSRKSPFTLSWSHYVELLPIKDPDERSFYEIEATNSGWSLPELRRQKASSLYHRLALSRIAQRPAHARRHRARVFISTSLLRGPPPPARLARVPRRLPAPLANRWRSPVS